MKSSLLLFFEKTQKRYLLLSDELSVVLHTSCVHLVRGLIIVALCDVGLKDDSSSDVSVYVSFLLTVVFRGLSSQLTRPCRKGTLPFSWISLVNCLSVFCMLRGWWNASNSLCRTAVNVLSM